MPENLNDKNETPDMVKRRTAGNEGKLWCIKIACKFGTSIRHWVRINLYYDELLKIREDIFIYGVMIPEDPGHFTIIPPWDLFEIKAEKQKSNLSFDPTKY